VVAYDSAARAFDKDGAVARAVRDAEDPFREAPPAGDERDGEGGDRSEKRREVVAQFRTP
jgi:hypothetical protein